MINLSDRRVGYRSMAGWLAIGISTAMACFWAFWGCVEGFHEGWYYHSLLKNLALMIGQYLSPMFVFMMLAAVSIRSPRLGAAAHLLFGFFITIIFRNVGIMLVFGVPLLVGGILYWIGQTEPKRWAYSLVIGFPLVTMLGAGIGPASTLISRIDDGYRGARLVRENGVGLVWAPQGPGWSQTGVNWFEANDQCERLNANGDSLCDTAVRMWRLPSLDELVRSGARHGTNVGGALDTLTMKAIYSLLPDKETPLWNRYSRVAYWWSSTEKDTTLAWMYCYNGAIFPQSKIMRPDYYGFRAVRSATPADSTLRSTVAPENP
ncbi:MAG: DUF1566 domain-containing protein [candidate division Zixibacteria bacterium]|nr:DUF1566 domain-containing protein [candidate division Zixibacteria bacterium]